MIISWRISTPSRTDGEIVTKAEKIKSIHKVLWVKEDVERGIVPYASFDACVSNCILRFSGTEMDEKLREKILDTLKGIKELGATLSHDEVRSAILGLMGDIDRGE